MPDGSLDTSFGDEGDLTDFGENSYVLRVIVREGDAPAVLAYEQQPDFRPHVRALGASGAPEAGFGTDGEADLTGTLWRELHDTPAGLLAVGEPDLLTLLQPDGTIDPGVSAPASRPTALRVSTMDASGRLLYTGFEVGGSITIGRLATDGSIDTTFGTAGALVRSGPSTASYTRCVDLEATDDGGGLGLCEVNSGDALANEAMVLRFDEDGVLDPAFGTAGTRTLFATDGRIGALAVQEDGRILIVYGQKVVSGVEWYVTRLETDGSTDTTFGTDGRTPIGREAVAAEVDDDANRLILLSTPSSGIGDGGLRLVRHWL